MAQSEICLGCKTSPCAYPIRFLDFRRFAYRWFDPNRYYEEPWSRRILTRYKELEDVLFQFPNMPPPTQWLSKHNAFMVVFDSMRTEGMVNPLIVKPMAFRGVRAPEDRALFERHTPTPDHVVTIGNQRFAVLRMFWEFGWLKSPMVGCRVSKPNDKNDDRAQAIFAHPYKIKKGDRWVNP